MHRFILRGYFQHGALACEAQTLGFEQIIDIGSGDGRIAYCGKILGLNSISIEIDENLVTALQKIIMARKDWS